MRVSTTPLFVFAVVLVACSNDPQPVAPYTPASVQPQATAASGNLDAAIRYNVDRVNAFRAQKGIPALQYDANIASFALVGSQRLSQDHAAHAHFNKNANGPPFGNRWAENQGDPSGVPLMDRDPNANTRKQIDTMLNLMMSEGLGGGHYDNIMNPAFRRIGVGIAYAAGRFYLTNDFSD